MMRPVRRYSIAGVRFEDALRVHHVEQIRELKAENERLRDEITRLKLELCRKEVA